MVIWLLSTIPQPKRLATAPATWAAATEVPLRVVMGTDPASSAAYRRPHYIDAWSCQLRLYNTGRGEAAAGVDVNTVVQVVIGPHCNGRGRIAGQGNGGVGSGTQKYGLIRY